MTDPARHYPFSSGTQFADWTENNCRRCKRYGTKPDPEKCEIDFAFGDAFWGDGSVSEDIAKRMGYLDNQRSLVWRCNEFEPIEDKP
ncbi:MAG: hypothetical protein ACYC36_13315 [Bellilinea sp.]